MKKIAIILVNWNNYSDTIECVKSLRKISYTNYKIVVVDNGSKNDSVKHLSKLKDIVLIESNENLGFTGGCNLGIKYIAKEEFSYVLLLNNDTIVKSDFLQHLVNFSEENQNVGIVGPLIYYFSDPKKIWFEGGVIDFIHGPFLHLEKKFAENGQLFKTRNVDYINGCCILIKREVIQKIGMLDEEYGTYVEDVDYNVRAHNAGYSSYIVYDSIIWHKVSALTGERTNFKKEYLKTRNAVLFGYKALSADQRMSYYFNFLKRQIVEVVNLITSHKLNLAGGIVVGLLVGTTKTINIYLSTLL